jgi:lysophospholipase L1-like esterase
MRGFFAALVLCLVISLASVQATSVYFVPPSPIPGSTINSPEAVFNVSVNTTAGSVSDFYTICDIDNTLLAWWPMDEGTSAQTYDRSGKGNTLTFTGGAGLSTQNFAHGVSSFRIVNRSIDYAYSTGSNINQGITSAGFTVSFWINLQEPTPTISYILGSLGSGNTGWSVVIANATGSHPSFTGHMLRLTLGDGTGMRFVQSLPYEFQLNTWYNVVVVYAHDKATFYVNGVPISSSMFYQSMPVLTSTDPHTYVGYPGYFGGPRAFLDDIALFNRPLGISEILALSSFTGVNSSYSALFEAHGFSSGNVSAVCSVLGQTTPDIASTSLLSFTANRSGPYFAETHAVVEPELFRVTLSTRLDPGFYSGSFALSGLSVAAFYRINGGNWVSFATNSYVPFSATRYGGMFGDSLTSQGGYAWPWMFDGLSQGYFLSANLTKGIGGAWCYRIRQNILQNATNGTTIFLECGTNDVGNSASFQSIISNYTAIFSDLRAKGNHVYLANIPPRWEPQFCSAISAVNTWLYDYYVHNNSDGLILGFADVHTKFVNASSCTINRTLAVDGIHPDQDGIPVYASTIFSQGTRYLMHDGFYAEFTPAAGPINQTYDFKWVASLPTGETSEYVYPELITVPGTAVFCPSDLDDGTGTGTPDGGTDVNDLLYFLAKFEAGSINDADLDDGTGTGTPDGGVDINDLLYFLQHFESGC